MASNSSINRPVQKGDGWEMKVGIIAFTARGYGLAARLQARLNAAGMRADCERCRAGALHDWTCRHFVASDALVFIGATGIAVRAVAPCLQSKVSDPAVVVIDERGKYLIPLLAGHLGGANRLARKIAAMLAATPVLTTATDCNGIFAIDTWAAENKIKIINPEQIKPVSARLLAGGKICFQSMFPLAGALPAGLVAAGGDAGDAPGAGGIAGGRDTGGTPGDNNPGGKGGRAGACDVIITVKTGINEEALQLVPPVLTLGIGCRKDTAEETIQEAFENFLEKTGCCREAVCRVCSIDLKAQEAGLLAFCTAGGLPLQTFTAEQLRAVPGHFTSSPFVRKTAGVGNVCERSAVLGSGGRLFVKKNIINGVTLALAIAPYTLRF